MAAPTVVVDAPTYTETKQAFDKVLLQLQNVLSQHEEVRMSMQGLTSGVEELCRACAGDMETMVQVQTTLYWTLSVSRSLEMRLGQVEEMQSYAHAMVEEARQASE